MNYETVKVFGNEQIEKSKYDGILDSLVKQASVVQSSLSNLNIGQAAIFTTGLTLNLMMAANGVAAGSLTTGDFVMI